MSSHATPGEIWIGPAGHELIGQDVLGTPLLADENGVQPMEKLGFLGEPATEGEC